MCGIVGLLGEYNNKENYIYSMLDAIRHRGPDEKSVFHDGDYFAGMRRLSINGLSDGSQPLYNQDRTVVLFYNGEIYNSVSLKKELEGLGVTFRTHSDGEVIAHLYDRIGLDVFEKLDGMFAISIWDIKRQRLVLARDLAGEKPLYYSKKNNKFAYASEIKALRTMPELNLTLNRQALWDFPTFLWIPEPTTAFNEIFSLPKGTYMVSENGNSYIEQFKNNHTIPEFDLSDDDEIISVVRETVENAVKLRLLSDVSIGSFLSGGLDSSIVATIAARNLRRLDTFTVSFENVADPYHGHADESIAAAETAALIGSRHHNIKVTAESFRNSLDDFSHYGDLPFGVSSGLGILAVTSAAQKEGIKVLLTGDGADETFGGYSWYKYFKSVECNYPSEFDTHISFQNFGIPLKKRLSILNQMKPKNRAWAWHYYASENEKQKLFSNDWGSGLKASLRYFEMLDRTSTPESFIQQDRDFYLPNEMLRKVDRMGMAYSVEGRTPFVAPQILKLSDKLSYKYMVRGDTLKWALRNAFKDILPMNIINRPKHGFNVPIDYWLKEKWADLVEETFSSDSELSRQGMLASNAYSVAQNMIHDKERLNGHTIFCFIMLNKWLSN